MADDRVVAEAHRLAAQVAAHEVAGVHRIKAGLRQSGLATSAAEWFDRVTATDPLGGANLRPRAAENR